MGEGTVPFTGFTPPLLEEVPAARGKARENIIIQQSR